MESGENPEQAYPYCDADKGSKRHGSGHWIERSGKALPEEEAKSGYNLAETMLWEEAQDLFLLFNSVSFPKFPYCSGNLLELYQQMESGIFLKWYYENQLIISTTKEKLVRYKNGKLCFYLPLEL